MTKTSVFIEGSFFYQKCNREYEEKGTKNEDKKGESNMSLDDKVKKLKELLK